MRLNSFKDSLLKKLENKNLEYNYFQKIKRYNDYEDIIKKEEIILINPKNDIKTIEELNLLTFKIPNKILPSYIQLPIFYKNFLHWGYIQYFYNLNRGDYINKNKSIIQIHFGKKEKNSLILIIYPNRDIVKNILNEQENIYYTPLSKIPNFKLM